MYLLGVDLGTTGCKSMLFDRGGQIVSQSYIEYELIRVSETEIEQDAGLWWEMVKRAISETVGKSGIIASEIKALSISSQGISFVPVDSSIIFPHDHVYFQ